MTSRKTQSRRPTSVGHNDMPTAPAKQSHRTATEVPTRQDKTVQRRDSRPARPRGPVEAPHSGAQKDSTEQRSLMKPYYFNPDEE